MKRWNEMSDKYIEETIAESFRSLGLKDYATSREDALDLVEKLSEHLRIVITIVDPVCGTRYYCNIVAHLGQGNFNEYSASENTLPRAICYATLKYLDKVRE